MAYRRLDYTLAARSLPEDHPHALHIKLPTPTRSTLTRKASLISKLKAKISRKDLRGELYDDDAASLDSRYDMRYRLRMQKLRLITFSSIYSQDMDANLDGARGRRSALALCDGDDQLMANAMKKHEEQKAMFRAPSKHAPDSVMSRGPSSMQQSITPGTGDIGAIGRIASKPRICADMASWTQFPSHTRADRCGSAGPLDTMSVRDFGDPARTRLGAVTPAYGDPQSIRLTRRRSTKDSTKSKKRRGLVKSTSQGLEQVGRYYSNLFATANFRGNNRRTSVSVSTGALAHPELEMLAPAHVVDSHQPVHDHLKKVDADLGMLSSVFRIPSFSRLGHHHSKAAVQPDDEPEVGPDEEEGYVLASASASRLETPTAEPARKINWGGMPFRKLSTFFLVESKDHKPKRLASERVDGEELVPPERDEPPFGIGQLDGAATETDTIDTLDTIEGAEMKSG